MNTKKLSRKLRKLGKEIKRYTFRAVFDHSKMAISVCLTKWCWNSQKFCVERNAVIWKNEDTEKTAFYDLQLCIFRCHEKLLTSHNLRSTVFNCTNENNKNYLHFLEFLLFNFTARHRLQTNEWWRRIGTDAITTQKANSFCWSSIAYWLSVNKHINTKAGLYFQFFLNKQHIFLFCLSVS